VFHGRERGTAFGIWGAVTGGSVAVGPLVGGALTRGVGWEAIFFVNVPIGVAAIALAQLKLAEAETAARGRIDWPGLLTFSTGLFCFVLALIEGNDRGWGSTRIVALFTAAVVLLAAFVVLEHRRRDPMLDLTLFRKPAFGGASIAAFVLSAAMFSLFLYLTLYVQDILGYDPLETGLRFLPSTLLSFLVAPIAGRLSARVPVRGRGLRGREPGGDRGGTAPGPRPARARRGHGLHLRAQPARDHRGGDLHRRRAALLRARPPAGLRRGAVRRHTARTGVTARAGRRHLIALREEAVVPVA